MVSVSVTGTVSSVVRYIANLSENFLFICLLHEMLESFVLQVKSSESQYK